MIYLLVSFTVTDAHDEYAPVIGDIAVKSTMFPSRHTIRKQILDKYELQDSSRHQIAITSMFQFQNISDFTDFLREPNKDIS